MQHHLSQTSPVIRIYLQQNQICQAEQNVNSFGSYPRDCVLTNQMFLSVNQSQKCLPAVPEEAVSSRQKQKACPKGKAMSMLCALIWVSSGFSCVCHALLGKVIVIKLFCCFSFSLLHKTSAVYHTLQWSFLLLFTLWIFSGEESLLFFIIKYDNFCE